MKRKLGLLLTVLVGAYAMTACVVVDDDYICDDGQVLFEVGDVSCDTYIDCDDGSDEWNCGVYDDYICDDGEVLIEAGDVSCDSIDDCEDFSDELGCDGCLGDEVYCLVFDAYECAVTCDGDDECDDGMDEDAYYCGY